MTCHANQQPLPYTILNRPIQPGACCDHCGRALSLQTGLLGNAEGYFCNDACWLRGRLVAKERETTRGTVLALAVTAIILIAYIFLFRGL